MIDEKRRKNLPKKLYIVDYQLEQCEVDGIADARLNALPFSGLTNGKLVEYLCIDNLWHDASEEPKVNKHILYDKGKSLENNIPYGYECLSNRLTKDYWKCIVKIEHITRWLYIDDLLKGGNA